MMFTVKPLHSTFDNNKRFLNIEDTKTSMELLEGSASTKLGENKQTDRVCLMLRQGNLCERHTRSLNEEEEKRVRCHLVA